MDQVTATSRQAAEYEYDAAFRLIAQVQRAAASDEYLAGIVAGYENSGHPATAAKFTAAVAEQRKFAADEAESRNDTDGSDD
jgi:hypothetical protein